MSGLTTHILDLTHGKPAADVKIELFSIEGNNKTYVTTKVTNEDGRIDEPLLTMEDMAVGEYELLFYIGQYFNEKELKLPETPFLDKISVRIGIDDPSAHYHVPLLVSPWGYQVYRGS